MMNLEPLILAVISRAVIRMVIMGALLVSAPHALRTPERSALEVLVVSCFHMGGGTGLDLVLKMGSFMTLIFGGMMSLKV